MLKRGLRTVLALSSKTWILTVLLSARNWCLYGFYIEWICDQSLWLLYTVNKNVSFIIKFTSFHQIFGNFNHTMAAKTKGMCRVCFILGCCWKKIKNIYSITFIRFPLWSPVTSSEPALTGVTGYGPSWQLHSLPCIFILEYAQVLNHICSHYQWVVPVMHGWH